MEQEKWLPVKGYEGFYEVSNMGNVRSVDRRCNGKRQGSSKMCKGKVLNQITNYQGYKRVNLSVNQNRKAFFVHRLVADAFVENPNKFRFVNHKDENKGNNKSENLEWCTCVYNVNYGTRNQKVSTGMQNKRCKEVVGINDITGETIRFRSLGDAQRNGFSKYCIWAVINKYPQTHGGTLKTYRGYKWRYEETDENVISQNKRCCSSDS